MLNPIRLVNNLFNDKNLSDADLRTFTEDHLVKMSLPENNPGAIYSTLITDTTARYTAFFGKMTSEAIKKAIAEGTTATRNKCRKAVEEKISAFQGFVKFKFPEDSAEWQEFYPLGMGEYTEAKEGDVNTLFIRFKAALTAHLATDYPTEAVAFNLLLAAFQSAYTARETVVAAMKALQTGRHEDRAALTNQLYINFLTIAINNIGNPDRYDDYYDPRYLPLEDDNGHRNGDVAALAIAKIPISGLTLHDTSEAKLFNPGLTTLRYYFSSAVNTPPAPGAPFIEVAPAAEPVTVLLSALGFSAENTSFLVQNTEDAEGKYKVELGV